jgi:hypothetical protein
MDEELSERGRRLAALRPRITVECQRCGKTFTTYATGVVGRYCSHPCRQRAYQLAHAEQERARKRRAYQRRKAARSAQLAEVSVDERAPALLVSPRE